MPNIKSAKKRVKVINTKTMRNKAVKSDLKTALKKADAAVAENAENKEEVVRAAIKKVDMACTKGIMHKNAAARKVHSLLRSLANFQSSLQDRSEWGGLFCVLVCTI